MAAWRNEGASRPKNHWPHRHAGHVRRVEKGIERCERLAAGLRGLHGSTEDSWERAYVPW